MVLIIGEPYQALRFLEMHFPWNCFSSSPHPFSFSPEGLSPTLYRTENKHYLHYNEKIHDQDKGRQISSGYLIGWHEVSTDFVPVDVVCCDSGRYNSAHTKRNEPEGINSVTAASPKPSEAWAPLWILFFLFSWKKILPVWIMRGKSLFFFGRVTAWQAQEEGDASFILFQALQTLTLCVTCLFACWMTCPNFWFFR